MWNREADVTEDLPFDVGPEPTPEPEPEPEPKRRPPRKASPKAHRLEGQTVREADGTAFYLIDGGKKRHYTSFAALGVRPFVTVYAWELADIPDGDPITDPSDPAR